MDWKNEKTNPMARIEALKSSKSKRAKREGRLKIRLERMRGFQSISGCAISARSSTIQIFRKARKSSEEKDRLRQCCLGIEKENGVDLELSRRERGLGCYQPLTIGNDRIKCCRWSNADLARPGGELYHWPPPSLRDLDISPRLTV